MLPTMVPCGSTMKILCWGSPNEENIFPTTFPCTTSTLPLSQITSVPAQVLCIPNDPDSDDKVEDNYNEEGSESGSFGIHSTCAGVPLSDLTLSEGDKFPTN